MPIYTDQLGNTISLQARPTRIISLVPSQTELLADLGLAEEVIGITKFCVHPDDWFSNKTRVGGTKTLNIPLIASLSPDLIIANKEENVKEQIVALQNIAPVWVSDVNNLEDALAMIESIGVLTGKNLAAFAMTAELRIMMTALQIVAGSPGMKKYKTAYLIWKDPYMTAGGDTFISDLLQLAGWKNVFGELTRYPEITVEQLAAAGTELLLLSSEPYPFTQKHIDFFEQSLPGIKICLVDGEMFSWYGSRLLRVSAYLKNLLADLNPGFPLPGRG